jgi:hypothetical protein
MNDIFTKLKKLTRRSDGSFNPLSLVIIGAILFAVLPVLFAVVFLAYTTYDEIVSEPQSKQFQLDAEKEFRQIQPPPDAVPTSNNPSSTRKTHHGVVGMSYRTNLSYPEIRAYYDAELSKHGWKFQREEKVTVWDKDYGGKQVFYSKGKYTAAIYYPGEDPNADFKYGLDVSWGLHDW